MLTMVACRPVPFKSDFEFEDGSIGDFKTRSRVEWHPGQHGTIVNMYLKMIAARCSVSS